LSTILPLKLQMFLLWEPGSENKVHGKVACCDYIGSMKKAIEVESPTKKK